MKVEQHVKLMFLSIVDSIFQRMGKYELSLNDFQVLLAIWGFEEISKKDLNHKMISIGLSPSKIHHSLTLLRKKNLIKYTKRGCDSIYSLVNEY